MHDIPPALLISLFDDGCIHHVFISAYIIFQINYCVHVVINKASCVFVCLLLYDVVNLIKQKTSQFQFF